jgi:uncharacterized protein
MQNELTKSKVKRSIVFSCFIIITNWSIAQNEYSLELSIISEKYNSSTNFNDSYYDRAGNSQKVMEVKHKTLLNKINPVNIFFKSAMAFYQNIVSPQLSKTCPYTITCSNFSKLCIKEFGIFKGIFLTADRVNRCNRISLLDVSIIKRNESTNTINDPIHQYCHSHNEEN